MTIDELVALYQHPVPPLPALAGERNAAMREPHNTNHAAEFYVMSALYRLGADAALSLGNGTTGRSSAFASGTARRASGARGR